MHPSTSFRAGLFAAGLAALVGVPGAPPASRSSMSAAVPAAAPIARRPVVPAPVPRVVTRRPVVLAAASVAVAADSASVTAGGGRRERWAGFTLHNTGATGARVLLQAGCAGAGVVVASCVASMREVYLPAGATAPVRVTFTTPEAGGTGSATLTATDAATGVTLGSSSVAVAVTAAPLAIVTVPTFEQGPDVERSLCPIIAIVPGAAAQCGGKRLAHALPAVRAFGKTYTPTLAYFSDLIQAPFLLLDVALPATTPIPDSVVVTVYTVSAAGVRGGVVKQASYPGAAWATIRARRLNLRDIVSDAYLVGTFDVAVQFLTGTTLILAAPIVRGEVVPIIRRAGATGSRADWAMGYGWSLLGLEELMPGQYGGVVTWIGGDGSTRKYTPAGTSGGVTTFTTTNIYRPDTLYRLGDGSYRRPLPHGASVYFDAAGLHRRTVDRHGRETTFGYDNVGKGRLATITVPGNQAYTFAYSAAEITITAPGGRVVRMVHTVDGAGVPDPGILGFVDPDGSVEIFHYDFGHVGITGVTDARSTYTALGWDAWSNTLGTATTTLAGQPAVMGTLVSAKGRGSAPGSAPEVTGLPDYVFDGPRTDVSDVTQLWADARGALTRTVDATGRATLIEHGDPRFPGLVTRVVQPNGFEMRASYDAKGRLVASTAVNPHSDGQDATTVYGWDPVWDVVTRVTLPEGEVTRRGLDAGTGDVLWEQDGDSVSTRADFAYDPVTRQLAWVRAPGAAAAERTHLEYGATGNLSRVISPTGLVTRRYADAIGRDTLVLTPLDAAQQFQHTTRIAYDVMDRDTLTIATAPQSDGLTFTPAQPESLIVRTEYDIAGAVRSVARRAAPDLNGLGVIRTLYGYDGLGRKITEIAPDLREDHYDYDLPGNLTSWQTRRGHTIAMTYDALSRLLTRTVPATDGLLAEQFVNSYDPVTGALATATSRYSQIGRTYYPNGALKTETQSLASAGGSFGEHVYSLGYAYDRNGRRATLTYPSVLGQDLSAMVLPYGYDWRGNLAAVGGITLGYDVAGRRDRTSYPNGVVERQRYDAEGRLAHRWQRSPTYLGGISGVRGTDGVFTTDTIHSDLFAYDARGKILAVSSLTESVTNGYAGLGGLARSVRWPEYPAPGTGTTEIYVGDALGNRRSQSYYGTAVNANELIGDAPLQRYEPGTGRHLGSDVPPNGWSPFGDSLRYDAAGNMTREMLVRYIRGLNVSSGTRYSTPVGKLTTLIYDAQQRLRGTTRQTSRGAGMSLLPQDEDYTEEIRYDALGRRIWVRTRYGSPTFDCGGCNELSSVQRFLWDGDQLLGEVRAPAAWTALADTLETDAPIVRDSIPCRAPGAPVVGLPTQMPTECPVDEMGQPIPPTWRYHPHFGRVRYIHGPGIDAPLRVDRLDYGAGTLFLAEFSVYPHANWRGLTDAVTFTDGRGRPSTGAHPSVELPGQNVTAYSQVPAPIAPPASWMGSLLAQQRDASGLMYMRNRYYDPQTGHFTQEDPIGIAGGLNVYGFANGDPVNLSDPFGLCPPAPSCLALAGGSAVADGPLPIGDIVAIGFLGTAAWYAIRATIGDRAVPQATDQVSRRQSAGVTVRLQAQGGGLEESVVINSGAEGVVTGADALAALNQMQSSLNPSDAAARATAFAKAARYIQNAAAGGGVGPSKKTNTEGVGTRIRVDVEVLRGQGLTPGPRSDANVIP